MRLYTLLSLILQWSLLGSQYVFLNVQFLWNNTFLIISIYTCLNQSSLTQIKYVYTEKHVSCTTNQVWAGRKHTHTIHCTQTQLITLVLNVDRCSNKQGFSSFTLFKNICYSLYLWIIYMYKKILPWAYMQMCIVGTTDMQKWINFWSKLFSNLTKS